MADTPTAGNDILIGGSGNDTINGLGGDDWIVGMQGNDTLIGGGGFDCAVYVAGIFGGDIGVSGSAAVRIFHEYEFELAGSGSIVIKDTYAANTSEGRDTVQDFDVIVFGAYESGGLQYTLVTGTSGGETLTASPAHMGLNLILAGDGDDIVYEDSNGADVILGGSGTDTYSAANREYSIVHLGNGYTYASDFEDPDRYRDGARYDVVDGFENLVGGSVLNYLTGSEGDNRIEGTGTSSDFMDGGLGNDTLVAGDGADTLVFTSTKSAGVTVDLAAGTSKGAGDDTIVGFENVVGADGDDTITGDGEENVLIGGAGDDKLEGGGGDDRLAGGKGADTISGGDGQDTVVLLSDYLNNPLVNDAIVIAAQFAFALKEDGSFSVTDNGLGGAPGTQGADTIRDVEFLYFGSEPFEVKIGGAAPLEGGYLYSVILGTSGGDILGLSGFGNVAGDLILAGDGDDTVMGSVGSGFTIGNDIIYGGDGTDELSYVHDTAGVTVSLLFGLASGAEIGEDVVAGFENLVGGAGGDTLEGDDADNRLEGGKGDDTLIGGGGTDTAVLENVPFESGIPLNRLVADAFTFEIAGDKLEIAGSEGTDTLFAGIERIETSGYSAWLNVGTEANDWLVVESASMAQLVVTGGGDDRVDAGMATHDDIIDGGDGADTLSYSQSSLGVTVNLVTGVASGDESGHDAIRGFENVIGTDASDHVTGDDGRNVLIGLAGDDVLAGGGGDDLLVGGEGDDELLGGDGSDRLFGGAGHDRLISSGNGLLVYMTGGTGDDVYYNYGSSNAVIIEHADEGIDTVYSLHSHRLRDHVENLHLVAFATQGLGNDLDNIIVGNLSIDTIYSDPVSNLLMGFGGNDTLTAGDGDDSLYGGDGNDTLDAGMGRDRLYGGDGDDFLRAGIGRDIFDGGAGVDVASFEDRDAGVTMDLRIKVQRGSLSERDTLIDIENLVGTAFKDKLTGNALDNVFGGEDGADEILGLGGNDTLYGDDGDDTLRGGDGDDWIEGGAGNDFLQGGSGNDFASYLSSDAGVTVDLRITNSGQDTGQGRDRLVGIENLVGSGHADKLTGNGLSNVFGGEDGADEILGLGGNDTIYGDAGDDRLYGGAGNDTLHGGEGRDVLHGGEGHDKFVFNLVDTTDGTAFVDGADRILDFVSGADVLVLSAFEQYGGGGERLSESQFHVLGSGFQGETQHIVYDAARGLLYLDDNASEPGGRVLIANLGAGTALSAADIILDGV